MPRPTSLPPALVAAVVTVLAAVLAGLVAGVAPLTTPPAAARTAADAPPLSISLDSIYPSTIPRKGPIRVTGSVTNDDDAAWTAVQVYGFIGGAQPGSLTPMRSAGELVAAARTDPAAYVGDRITKPGTYATLDRIEPGQSQQFAITIPRSQLPVTEPGVYWFGVHALGAGPDGRIEGADGRARTFLPLVVGHRKPPVDTALVLPLRKAVSYAPDGSVRGLRNWERTLQPGGRLRSMVDFGAAAGDRPVTWLLDPGLPEVVRSLTAGNPARLAVPPRSGDEDGGASSSASPSASGSPTDPPSEEGAGTGSSTGANSELAAVADAGNAWLDRLHEALDGNQVLALPYGDVDAAAASRYDPELLHEARKRSGDVLSPWGIPMTPGLAAPSGFLPSDTLTAAPKRATVLLSDRELGGPSTPTVAAVAGRKVIAVSQGASSGGPGPGPRRAPIAMRQRILAEAAVRFLDPAANPLVVLLPSDWTPNATTDFFDGLDVPWLRLTSVADISARAATPVSGDGLRYSRHREARELNAPAFTAAGGLVRAGATLQDVLGDQAAVAAAVRDQAMTSVSFGHRDHPHRTRATLEASRSWIEGQLGSIRIDAPPAVTLSSTSGRFAATLSNGLDRAVTVHVQALTGPRVHVEGPRQIPLGPGGSATVLLTASTSAPGVHNITLVVTDSDGTPLGASDRLPIRSAQVSRVIWLIIGTGLALLFLAIALRLVRRVRAARGARGARL
ncbi:DUF6049 family protein [Nocardioides panaciterrulae]|uniref:Uncharacterized protein n=1 Tax=Nocardioides panaciterrulae TaxID=661492 RepID=A0A7Y9E2V0_9ACTN|nr:hypothetical protein [Nocardioides panaciterrulae]